jgi:hypothetical protein
MAKQNVTLPKKVAVVETPSSNPDKFCAYEGNQPFFSSTDENLVHAVADKRKADLVHAGCDVRGDEHKVEVRNL